MKQKQNSFLKGLLSTQSRRWGLALGVLLSSAITIAALTIPNTFTSGTTISSTEMNANFAAVQSAINLMPYGVVVKPSADVAISSATTFNPALDIILKNNSGSSFDTGTSRFTVAAGQAGFYMLIINCATNGSTSGFRYKVDGGSSVQFANCSSTPYSSSTSIYLTVGQYVDFEHYCSKSCTFDVLATSTILAVVKLI